MFTLHIASQHFVIQNLMTATTGRCAGLLSSGGIIKNIKGDIKPAVNVSMDDMVLVEDLLESHALPHSLWGCTLLICLIQIESVQLAEMRVPSNNIITEYGTLLI